MAENIRQAQAMVYWTRWLCLIAGITVVANVIVTIWVNVTQQRVG